MNQLIIYTHPNPDSFNCAIMQLVKKTLEEKEHEVKVRDLYAEKFEPILSSVDFYDYSKGTVPDDVKTEQEYIKWADNIIVIYPLWWAGMPAILKGYIDRVFCEGFAYSITDGGFEKLLSGRSGLYITTAGNTKEALSESGLFDAIKLVCDESIFDFTGIKSLGHLFFTSVPYVGNEDRAKFLNEARDLIRKLF